MFYLSRMQKILFFGMFIIVVVLMFNLETPGVVVVVALLLFVKSVAFVLHVRCIWKRARRKRLERAEPLKNI